MKYVRAIIISGLAALHMACGDGYAPVMNGTDPTGADGSPAANAQVAMVSSDDGYGSSTHRFDPSTVTIVTGGEVTWANDSGWSHNVTFAAADGAPADIGNHASGSNARTFETAGTFNYQCTNHAGMSGTVTVVEEE